jgi:hypothetical protein
MSGWNSLVQEVQALNRPDALDIVRRQKMARVQQLTGRELVVYAADFTTINPIKAQLVGAQQIISLKDKDGFDEVTRNLQAKELDIVLVVRRKLPKR